MSYRWWVLVHLVGVLGLLATHGVSMGVLFRLRRERDLGKIRALLELSNRAIVPFYVAFVVLLAGGITATFVGDLWGFGWIWASIATLVVIIVVMYAVATSYYKRVRTIVDAMAGGSTAVSPEQLDAVLLSSRPLVVASVGLAGLAFILYLMVMKPSLGMSPSTEPVASSDAIEVGARDLEFTTNLLQVPVDEPFELAFDNRDVGIPHNVSIYDGDEAVFTGEIFPGPGTEVYRVPALPPGSYIFRCDVHPAMAGNLEAGL